MTTVDGRNPAAVRALFIPLFTRFYTPKVVQDFFHPEYVRVLIYFWLFHKLLTMAQVVIVRYKPPNSLIRPPGQIIATSFATIKYIEPCKNTKAYLYVICFAFNPTKFVFLPFLKPQKLFVSQKVRLAREDEVNHEVYAPLRTWKLVGANWGFYPRKYHMGGRFLKWWVYPTTMGLSY